MERIAIFPGSFDPITKGHESIVKRAIPLFDKIIIAIGINAGKNSMFDLEQRKLWIKSTFKNNPTIDVTTYSGLTVDYCKAQNVNFILRGLRSCSDFDYEHSIAQMNKSLISNVETIFLLTEPEFSHISSTIVRDIIRNNGKVEQFLPNTVTL
jgi:pantetheine-phosphate adenylyltransferase